MLKKKIVRGDYGRDVDKLYLLTEWPALRAERWGRNMFLAVKGTSGSIPLDVARFGVVGVAIAGLDAFLKADVDSTKLDLLMQEMMECVQIVRDEKAVNKETGDVLASPLTLPTDIEEVRTVLMLRSEVLALHTNFSVIDALLKLWADVQAAKEATPKP